MIRRRTQADRGAILAVALMIGACAGSGDAGSVNGPVLASPSPPPGELEGMAAEVRGELDYDDSSNCLRLELEGVRYPVVWPAGTRWQEDPPAVVLADGRTAPPGATVLGGGGYLSRDHVAEVAGDEVAAAAQRCAGPTAEIAFFNPGSEVEVR